MHSFSIRRRNVDKSCQSEPKESPLRFSFRSLRDTRDSPLGQNSGPPSYGEINSQTTILSGETKPNPLPRDSPMQQEIRSSSRQLSASDNDFKAPYMLSQGDECAASPSGNVDNLLPERNEDRKPQLESNISSHGFQKQLQAYSGSTQSLTGFQAQRPQIFGRTLFNRSLQQRCAEQSKRPNLACSSHHYQQSRTLAAPAPVTNLKREPHEFLLDSPVATDSFEIFNVARASAGNLKDTKSSIAQIIPVHGILKTTGSADSIKTEVSTEDILMKSITEFKTTKAELEIQKCEVTRLQQEVNDLTALKTDNAQRLEFVQEKAKRNVELASRRLGEMQQELALVKEQSLEFFQMCTEAKAELAEVDFIKKSASEAIDNNRVLFDENKRFIPGEEIRSVVKDLQAECTSKQQVLDLLRDRLKSTQSDLLDAKSRSADLELVLSKDRNTLESITVKLSEMTAQYEALLTGMKESQHNLTDTMAKNIELEIKLSTYFAEIESLRSRILEQDEELKALGNATIEINELKHSVESKDSVIKTLRQEKTELLQCKTSLIDLQTKLHEEQLHLSENKTALNITQASLNQLETQHEQTLENMKKMEIDLMNCRNALKYEAHIRTQLCEEKTVAEQHLEVLQRQNRDLMLEVEEWKSKFNVQATRFEALQERCDDQNVALRLEKTAHAELQEHLIGEESTFKKDLEENTSRYLQQLDRLHDEKHSLEQRLNTFQSNSRDDQERAAARLSDLEAKFNAYRESSEGEARNIIERASRAESELECTRRETDLLRTKLEHSNQRIGTLSEQLQEAQSAKCVPDTTVQRLRETEENISNLQIENRSLSHRAKSICSRYEIGDLMPEEKALIDLIHRAAQSSHEHDMVLKGNEIRKRENTIKLLEAKCLKYETELARKLVSRVQLSQSKEHKGSLIDPRTFASQISSDTNLAAYCRAPDRDEAVDDVLPSPINIKASERLVLRNNPKDNQVSTDPGQEPQISPKPAHTPFSSLAADEIEDDIENIVESYESPSINKRKWGSLKDDIQESFSERPVRRSRQRLQKAAGVKANSLKPVSATMAPKQKPRKRK